MYGRPSAILARTGRRCQLIPKRPLVETSPPPVSIRMLRGIVRCATLSGILPPSAVSRRRSPTRTESDPPDLRRAGRGSQRRAWPLCRARSRPHPWTCGNDVAGRFLGRRSEGDRHGAREGAGVPMGGAGLKSPPGSRGRAGGRRAAATRIRPGEAVAAHAATRMA
jgi:hypothetical protein